MTLWISTDPSSLKRLLSLLVYTIPLVLGQPGCPVLLAKKMTRSLQTILTIFPGLTSQISDSNEVSMMSQFASLGRATPPGLATTEHPDDTTRSLVCRVNLTGTLGRGEPPVYIHNFAG
ncbi:hypothetical protein BD779DRAFT_245705 [Infundibulicybe gibba]|nr:hypothetical protein BD779DRAFT_245705 [Infundibulicybe gibba]